MKKKKKSRQQRPQQSDQDLILFMHYKRGDICSCVSHMIATLHTKEAHLLH